MEVNETLVGEVLFSKEKTARVVITSTKKTFVGKIVKVKQKLLAHDADNQYVKGDLVLLRHSRRYSKLKSWEIVARAAKSGNQEKKGGN